MRSLSTEQQKNQMQLPKQIKNLYIDTNWKAQQEQNKSTENFDIVNFKIQSTNQTENFVEYDQSKLQLPNKTAQFSNSRTQEIQNVTGNQNSLRNLNSIAESQLDFTAQKIVLRNNNFKVNTKSQMKLSKTLISNNENFSTEQSSQELVELQKDFKMTKISKQSKFRASFDIQQAKKTSLNKKSESDETVQLPNKTIVSKFLENQKQEEKKSEIQISNSIKELERDKLIQFDENLNPQAFESTNKLSASSQNLESEINLPQKDQTIKIALNQQQSENQLSYCSLSKKLLSKQFFMYTPSADTPIQYYVFYLMYQTVRSSEIRNHSKKNFGQFQYLKQEIFPNLSKLPEKFVDLPKPAHKKNMKTLVLDLDETLVHCVDFIDSCSCINSVHDINLSASPEFSPYLLQLSFRPGLQNFLKSVSEMFEVIVFTASERTYAEKTVEKIDPNGYIDGILSREDCIKISSEEYLKDLNCLQRPEGSIVIVDNSLGAVKQIEALIPIVPYSGDETDTQLTELLTYLKELSQLDDMIKRNKKFFEWELFFQSPNHQEFFKNYRQIKRKEFGILN